MSKHTPGPWLHEAGAIADIVFHANGIATLATIHHGVGLGDDESHANARLMAAAPDMLAALKEGKRRLQGAGMLGGDDDPVCVAIAKAEGVQ